MQQRITDVNDIRRGDRWRKFTCQGRDDDSLVWQHVEKANCRMYIGDFDMADFMESETVWREVPDECEAQCFIGTIGLKQVMEPTGPGTFAVREAPIFQFDPKLDPKLDLSQFVGRSIGLVIGAPGVTLTYDAHSEPNISAAPGKCWKPGVPA